MTAKEGPAGIVEIYPPRSGEKYWHILIESEIIALCPSEICTIKVANGLGAVLLGWVSKEEHEKAMKDLKADYDALMKVAEVAMMAMRNALVSYEPGGGYFSANLLREALAAFAALRGRGKT